MCIRTSKENFKYCLPFRIPIRNLLSTNEELDSVISFISLDSNLDFV